MLLFRVVVSCRLVSLSALVVWAWGCAEARPQAHAADEAAVGATAASVATTAEEDEKGGQVAQGLSVPGVVPPTGTAVAEPDLTGVVLPELMKPTAASDAATVRGIDPDGSLDPSAWDDSPIGARCAALARIRIELDARRRKTVAWGQLVGSAQFVRVSSEVATATSMSGKGGTVSAETLKQRILLDNTIREDIAALSRAVAAIEVDDTGIAEIPTSPATSANLSTDLEQCALQYFVYQSQKKSS